MALPETIEEWGDKCDALDKRLAEVIAANPTHLSIPPYTVQRVMDAREMARLCYIGVSRAKWMAEQDDITPRKYRPATVRECWRDVEVARAAYAAIRDQHSTRQTVDALIALEAAEGLYDLVRRAADGVAPRTWSATHQNRIAVRPPKCSPTKNNRSRAQSRRSLAAMMEC